MKAFQMKSFVGLVSILALCSVGYAAAAEFPRLFGASVQMRTAETFAPAVMRTRSALPDPGLLARLAAETTDQAEGPYFTLDLFDDLALEAQVMRTERTVDGGIAIIARLTGPELGSVVLVQDGVAMSGSVTYPGGAFSILPQTDGVVRIAEVAQHLLPPDGEPRRVEGAPLTAADIVAADAPADTGKLIDVIVFWTPAAQTAAGGLANIQNNINTAVTLTNDAYKNSGIAQRIRLVNKQGVTYTEDTSVDDAFSNALAAIKGATGTLAGTAALRDTYGADEVVLVIDDPALCGRAYMPATISSGNSIYGFAVVGGGVCLTTNFSFGHEMGHNMGANHDPYEDPGPGAFAYSHGLSHIGATLGTSWRTIMAFPNECAATVGGCTRLQYFSNPMVTYTDGNPMGDGPLRNNALTLNKSANVVSNYRAQVVPITASFADVPLGHQFFGYVEFMYQGGYTSGCGTVPLRYCPDDPITRGEMAVFLERTMRGALFIHAPTGTVFSDVTVGTTFAGFIEQLYADGVTSGCVGSPPNYCPAMPVTREQMAKFLLLAKCGSAYLPNIPGSSPFADVLVSNPFLRWINKIYTLGITSGCGGNPPNYCPADPVTREQMGKFIYGAFPYGTPSETCTP